MLPRIIKTYNKYSFISCELSSKAIQPETTYCAVVVSKKLKRKWNATPSHFSLTTTSRRRPNLTPGISCIWADWKHQPLRVENGKLSFVLGGTQTGWWLFDGAVRPGQSCRLDGMKLHYSPLIWFALLSHIVFQRVTQTNWRFSCYCSSCICGGGISQKWASKEENHQKMTTFCEHVDKVPPPPFCIWPWGTF